LTDSEPQPAVHDETLNQHQQIPANRTPEDTDSKVLSNPDFCVSCQLAALEKEASTVNEVFCKIRDAHVIRRRQTASSRPEDRNVFHQLVSNSVKHTFDLRYDLASQVSVPAIDQPVGSDLFENKYSEESKTTANHDPTKSSTPADSSLTDVESSGTFSYSTAGPEEPPMDEKPDSMRKEAAKDAVGVLISSLLKNDQPKPVLKKYAVILGKISDVLARRLNFDISEKFGLSKVQSSKVPERPQVSSVIPSLDDRRLTTVELKNDTVLEAENAEVHITAAPCSNGHSAEDVTKSGIDDPLLGVNNEAGNLQETPDIDGIRGRSHVRQMEEWRSIFQSKRKDKRKRIKQ
jgi:hypothetical protein